MRLLKIGITFLAVLSLTVETPLSFNLTTLSRVPQVLAETPANRKAEADRLLQQGIKLFPTSQFEAALESWQQALTIYREIGDRQGEAHTLVNIGLVYSTLGGSQKAIDFYQQSLAIARAIDLLQKSN